jgi:outer membrane receptor protein involved in Fe transport
MTVLPLSLVASLLLPRQSAAQQPPPESQAAPAGQTASPAAAEPAIQTATGPREASEEIFVTGSRIRRKDLTTPAPVTVISKEQVVASGKVSLGDFLQSLPEQGNATNTSVNNGGDGSTRIDLRGLGTARTLVLLNGHRVVPGGTGANASVDLNTIPTAMIERIEILKDGASAVYGSDAIAGVVNIITRKHFSGAEATAFTGGATRGGDGFVYDFSATVGSSSERGNVLFGGGYFKQQPVWAGDRSFSRTPVAFDAVKGIVISQGSGTVPEGRIIVPTKQIGLQNGNTVWNNLIAANQTAASFIRCNPADTTIACDPSGWREYRGASLASDPIQPGDGYNFQPDNYLLTPSQRISLFSTGDVNMGSYARGYFDASYVNYQQEQKLAAEPLGTSGEKIVVSANNIYNIFGRDFTSMSRRLNEFGNRSSFRDFDTFRVITGINGTLPEEAGPARGWYWDASFNYGRSVGSAVKNGNLFRPALQAALGPSQVDAANVPRCVTKVNLVFDPKTVIPGCVPLNLFGGPNTITQDQVAGLTFTGNSRGINQLTAVEFNTSGELFRLMSERPISLSLGYNFSNYYGANTPDPVTVAGLTTGNKGAITKGGYHVNEGYGELSVPIVSNVPLAEMLEATAALRLFNYDAFGSDKTYKLGARWQIVRDLTVRGTYSTAFRVPSIGELFGGQSDSFPPASDPCRLGPDPITGLPRAPPSCGAAAGNGDTSTQLRARIGGQPNLIPETAKIFTAGIVIEPRWIKNLTITADYYNFRIFDSITPIGVGVILAACYPQTGVGDQNYCNLVSRDANNVISTILNLTTNVGSDKTDGVDIAARYELPTEYGRFGFIFDGTLLHKFDRTLGDGTVIHARGTYDLGSGLGGVYPSFKFNAGVNWSMGGFSAGVSTRYIGKFKECADSTGLMNGAGGLCYVNDSLARTVHPYNTYDLFLAYSLNTTVGKTSISAGMLNVFDRDPPLVYDGFLAATDPTAYDVVGRRVYARLQHRF